MKTQALSVVLSLVFLASGGAKLVGLEFEILAFERWGYPLWFMYFIGSVEVAGAMGLVVRRVSAAAAGGLALMMLGAMGTHVIHSEWGMLSAAAAFFAMSAARAFIGRQDIVAWLPYARLRQAL